MSNCFCCFAFLAQGIPKNSAKEKLEKQKNQGKGKDIRIAHDEVPVLSDPGREVAAEEVWKEIEKKRIENENKKIEEAKKKGLILPENKAITVNKSYGLNSMETHFQINRHLLQEGQAIVVGTCAWCFKEDALYIDVAFCEDGHGFGGAMLLQLEHLAKKYGKPYIRLSAIPKAKDYWAKQGFSPTSSDVDDGRTKETKMHKSVRSLETCNKQQQLGFDRSLFGLQGTWVHSRLPGKFHVVDDVVFFDVKGGDCHDWLIEFDPEDQVPVINVTGRKWTMQLEKSSPQEVVWLHENIERAWYRPKDDPITYLVH